MWLRMINSSGHMLSNACLSEGMQQFFDGMGLTISPTKMGVIVSNRPPSGTALMWLVIASKLPLSALKLERRRRRRKFNSFIQPAMAYENGSVFMSGPLTQRPI